MTITCQPMDAAEGTDLPAYSASNERQANAVMYGGGSGLPLAARSGFRPGTGNVLTATSTTWTLQPCAIAISPKATTAQGSYRWATDANASGALVAANATLPRKDIVYIQVNDSSSGDGSGGLNAPVLYLAGTPSATPEAPDLPDRSFLVGTISVPQVGAGSPTVVRNPAVFVSAGGIQPVSGLTERGELSAYDGLVVRRMDLPGRPLDVRDATGWQDETPAPITFAAGSPPVYRNAGTYYDQTLADAAVTRNGRRISGQGAIANNVPITFNANTEYIIGTVPAGFRPATRAPIFQVAPGGYVCTMWVTTAGQIRVSFFVPVPSQDVGKMLWPLDGIGWNG
ncbi:hypothetical protein [Paenarthrobacter sp. TA1.8]|uniref:hypothetical protein n=1 Tax=Paenarthrobacter sp. TA1.8 TaxID=3400219 RepID=UPI003B4336F3